MLHIFYGWKSVYLKPIVGKNSFAVQNVGVRRPYDEITGFAPSPIFSAHFLLPTFQGALLAFQPKFQYVHQDGTCDFGKSPETLPRAG